MPIIFLNANGVYLVITVVAVAIAALLGLAGVSALSLCAGEYSRATAFALLALLYIRLLMAMRNILINLEPIETEDGQC